MSEEEKKEPEDLEAKAEEKKDADAQQLWGCGHYYSRSCSNAQWDPQGTCIRHTYNTCHAGFD